MVKVCVVGLGYVGLPLACLCAKRGYDVIGIEKRKLVVDNVNAGRSHIKDETIQKSLDSVKGRIRATLKIEDAADCIVFIICVPTPVLESNEPDFEPLVAASKAIAGLVKKNDLVVVESTVFPGTCEEYVLPYLEKGSGLKADSDFHFAHCPERVNPGDVFWTTENIPRVVGGLTSEATEQAALFYQSLLKGEIYGVEEVKKILRPKFIVDGKGYKLNSMPLASITKMNSLRDAEAVKVMENTVRDVNIAFVNELAKISDALRLDVLDIIEGMATKPFGKGPFYPGIGVGGHCIAVDPEWLKSASMKAGYFPRIIQTARDTNNSMPHFAVGMMEKAIREKDIEKPVIAVLGVTYKGNIDDPRVSPFYEVKKILQSKGYDFRVYDPWYEKENTYQSIEDALKGSNILMVATDHTVFKEKVTAEMLGEFRIKVVVDGRNCLDKKGIENAGILYLGIGR